MRNIAIIGAPVDLGAGRRGVDMGPSAIRYAGLKERLEALGHQVHDLGNIVVPIAEQIELPAPGEKLRYLEPLVEINRALARQVSAAVAKGAFPLVLGGDHSLAIGAVNGRGHPALTTLLKPDESKVGAGPVLRDVDVALVGIRDVDIQERAALRESGIHIFTMHDVDRRGLATVMEDAIARVSGETAGFHVSFDMDSLDPSEAPGVGTPVLGGIFYREAHLAMELVSESGRLIGLDLVEVNPILDSHNVTAELAVQFALSALG